MEQESGTVQLYLNNGSQFFQHLQPTVIGFPSLTGKCVSSHVFMIPADDVDPFSSSAVVAEGKLPFSWGLGLLHARNHHQRVMRRTATTPSDPTGPNSVRIFVMAEEEDQRGAVGGVRERVDRRPDVPARGENPKKILVKPPPPLELGANNKVAWESFINGFEWYAMAIELEDQPPKVQVAVFMSTIGSGVREIFNGFELSQAQQSNLKLIQERFAAYFAPSGNEIYESFKFNNLVQDEEECIDDFVTRVRTQASKCNFPAGSKSRLIRDRVIHGIRSTQMREEILKRTRLSLDETIAICKACEKAAEHSKEMAGTAGKVEVNAITKQKDVKKKHDSESPCDKCGLKHAYRNCPAYRKKCNKCDRIGHFAAMCKKSADSSGKQKSRGKIKQIEKELDSDSDSEGEKNVDALRIYAIKKGSKDQDDLWKCTMRVDHTSIVVNIDTGAQCNVITKKILSKLPKKDIEDSRVKRLITYDGGKINVIGRVKLDCVIRKKTVPLWFQVIQGDHGCVLDGKSAIKAGLIKRVNKINEDIFNGLGCLKDFVYDAKIVENPEFVIHPARVVPYKIAKEVKAEIKEMVKLGVIEPCHDATDAVSPMVVVKRNGKLRICADLTDVNKNVKRHHFPLTGIDDVAARISGSKYFTILDCKKGFWQVRLSERTSKLCTFATPWGLKEYNVKVKYVKGTEIPLADTLSRDCRAIPSKNDEENSDELEVNLMTCLSEDAESRYKVALSRDPVLTQVIKFVQKGWPNSSNEVPKCIRHFFSFRDELDFTDGLLFKGDRIVVPSEERSNALKNIHAGHSGVQASLRRARESVYWPGMSSEVINMIEKCKVCEKNQKSNDKETVFMKRIPEVPFEIVASDLFEFKGKQYVLIVDSYSGYYDFKLLKSTTSAAVIKFMKEKFSDFGIPMEVHSDGGPQYSSREFKVFAKEWGFKHIISSPYFARSNGLAERYVQTAKNLLKRCSQDQQDVRMALLMQRNTPGAELRAPVERLMSRKTRNPLSTTMNSLASKTVKKNTQNLKEVREKQKMYADRNAKELDQLPVGSKVRVQERDKSWTSGKVVDRVSDRSYNVELDDGRTVRRNRHFLHKTKAENLSSPIANSPGDIQLPPDATSSSEDVVDSNSNIDQQPPTPQHPTEQSTSAATSHTQVNPVSESTRPVVITRSGRISRPPERLGY
uniref:RNA-directed DNA polymerase n=1 Tax=Lutzomyia longipalpis TaxID=7200 RepID=A0A1B0CR30_LUTLO